ncbi:MAG: hypothetical protein ACE14P_08250 [Methanotrichaceae archaeon]
MKSSMTAGLILISLLLALSLGVVFAEVSKDEASPTSTANTTNNETNITSINITNDTMPLNATKNVTNPFKAIKFVSMP